MDQFEGAMGGTFEQFIKALPHIETKIQDDGSSCDGMLVLKMTPPPAVKQGFTMTIPIKTSEVCMCTAILSRIVPVGRPTRACLPACLGAWVSPVCIRG